MTKLVIDNSTPSHVVAGDPYFACRVVIKETGEAVPAHFAKHIHGIEPDVIYQRDDGWTLGAPAHLEDVARKMWEDSWVYVTYLDGNGWWSLGEHGPPLRFCDGPLKPTDQ